MPTTTSETYQALAETYARCRQEEQAAVAHYQQVSRTLETAREKVTHAREALAKTVGANISTRVFLVGTPDPAVQAVVTVQWKQGERAEISLQPIEPRS